MVLFIVGCAGSVLLCGLFSSCRGHSLVMVGGGFFIVVPSLMVHGACVLGHEGFNICASWALKHRLSNCGIPA